MKSRRWMSWLGVVIAIFAFLGAVGLVLMPASASGLPFSWRIRSNLSADYRYGETSASFGAFRLSIIGDMLRDMGIGDKEATQRENVMKLVMEAAVPTATAFDYEGNPPLTATPTKTKIPTATPTSTPEPTATRTPTRIPSKTPTEKPTDKPAATSVPITDSSPPVIADPGMITPPPGTFGSCSITISVSDAQITDSAPSSGIKWVKLKYKVYGGGVVYAGYFISAPLSQCSDGSTTSGGWDACYSGPSTGFDISIYPGFSAEPDYEGSSHFDVKVWMITEDNVGKSDDHFYGEYQLPSSCDDPPPPTDTPVPIDTTEPSIVSMDVSPGSGSILTSCVLNVNGMQIEDPAFSEGVLPSGVEVKNKESAGEYFYQTLGGLTGDFESGPGSKWIGSASGNITVHGVETGESFSFFGVLRDAAGNGPVYSSAFSYTLDPGLECP